MKKQTTIGKWLAVFSALIVMSSSALAQNSYTVAGVAESRRSQDISKLPKMDRDIIILQNVLNDLFNSGDNRFFSSSGNAKGIYVPGKGVIFNMGSGGIDYDLFIAEQLNASQKTKNEAKEDAKKSVANKEKETRLKSLSKEFLVNYGSILSDLKSGEQVMLNVNYTSLKEDDSSEGSSISVSGQATLIYRGSSKVDKKRMVSAIDYTTIDSYLSGKTSLQSAESKISQSIVESAANSAQDAKIMAGILNDLFQSNFDGIYRRSGKTSWTYFEGFGLMYDLNLTGARSGVMRFTTNVLTVKGTRTTETEEKSEKTEEQKKVEDNYDALIELVKESLVTYGRTLRSVKSDEVVILNINFGSAFRKTTVPKAVRLQVTKSQIEAYSKGQKSLEQLKKEIDITKLSSSTSFNGNFHYADFPESIISGTVHDSENHPARTPGIVRSVKK